MQLGKRRELWDEAGSTAGLAAAKRLHHSPQCHGGDDEDDGDREVEMKN